jgi:hypothetical protein
MFLEIRVMRLENLQIINIKKLKFTIKNNKARTKFIVIV